MAGALGQDLILPLSRWYLYVLFYSLDNYINAVVKDTEHWGLFCSCFLPLHLRVFQTSPLTEYCLDTVERNPTGKSDFFLKASVTFQVILSWNQSPVF